MPSGPMQAALAILSTGSILPLMLAFAKRDLCHTNTLPVFVWHSLLACPGTHYIRFSLVLVTLEQCDQGVPVHSLANCCLPYQWIPTSFSGPKTA